jgi:hypothetical protein
MHRHVYPSIGARFQTPEQCFLRRGEGSATPKGYSNARAERREGPVHAPPPNFLGRTPRFGRGGSSAGAGTRFGAIKGRVVTASDVLYVGVLLMPLAVALELVECNLRYRAMRGRVVVHDTQTQAGHVRLHTGATASLSCPSHSA